jgi:hypothetical protein
MKPQVINRVCNDQIFVGIFSLEFRFLVTTPRRG